VVFGFVYRARLASALASALTAPSGLGRPVWFSPLLNVYESGGIPNSQPIAKLGE